MTYAKKDIAVFSDIAAGVHSADGKTVVAGVAGSERALLIWRLYRRLNKPLIAILGTSREADRFVSDLIYFRKDDATPVWYFPAYNLLPYQLLSYHNETAAERIRILYELTQAETPPVVVTTVGAMMRKLMPRKVLLEYAELLMSGETLDRDVFIEKLISGGYLRTAIVEEPGDFCIRGGIIDVFSPLYADPLRIEFFGDTVDSLRTFSVGNQRKIRSVDEAIILPSREIVLKKNDLNAFVAQVRARAGELQVPVTKVRTLVDQIRNEGLFPGIESLMPLLYPEPDTVMQYLPDNSYIIQIEPNAIAAAAAETFATAEKQYATARDERRICVRPEQISLPDSTVMAAMDTVNTIVMTALPVENAAAVEGAAVKINLDIQDNSAVSSALRNPIDKSHLLKPLIEWIVDRKSENYTIQLVCGTMTQARRLQSLLSPYGVKTHIIEGPPDPERAGAGVVYICLGKLSAGFVWPDASAAIITENEIFGEKRRRSTRKIKDARSELLSLEDLKQGDLVVHPDHGIGRYHGLEKLQLNGVTNDFLLIYYRDDDKLYLPVERMNLARKYVGVDGIAPLLDKMGGKGWDRTKQKAKKEVEKIAGELLELYAARKVKKGHAFEAADSYFREFEAGFAYEETPDQIRAIDEVLDDMESSTPMDRLVCGDVGYGKTEVALRAAFKAVSDSKQAAVLVPTTVLAEQHYKTFCERFRQYPINIACLNRFRSPRRQAEIVAGLKDGTVDIVIGTHRLLQKDVGFKDVGLIVLDEEQRFGVKHKEKLKKYRETVDVLALTATPIPRTLHMSLMGIRDISVISTPPEQRHPIVTYISEFDDSVIAEAVRRECRRGGQIFFIHNNIHSIERIAAHIRKLVPEIRLAIAHGRMNEDALEKVMLQFIEKKIDLLVCTTIVESGLDIPSANTILINRADRFGLAQIYQLRGRVGRSDEQAYAYLFIPKDSVLGKDAQKRLKVLMEHSDLGAGFQIAMNDLQIRGGGDALGISQSGHIAAVGYDMFLQMLEDSISELKGKPVAEPLEPEINIALSAFVPEQYIADIDQRLATYRRLAKMTAVKEINALKAELQDRFGPVPEEVTHLLFKIMLKILSKNGGVKRIDLTAETLMIHFSALHQKYPMALVDWVADAPERFAFTPDQVLKVRLKAAALTSMLAETKNILKEIARRVNP